MDERLFRQICRKCGERTWDFKKYELLVTKNVLAACSGPDLGGFNSNLLPPEARLALLDLLPNQNFDPWKVMREEFYGSYAGEGISKEIGFARVLAFVLEGGGELFLELLMLILGFIFH